MRTTTKAGGVGALLVMVAAGLTLPALVSGDARDTVGANAAAAAAVRPLVAQLRGGTEEVPNPGDPDGSGAAAVTINTTTGEICWDLRVANIDAASAAHIHRGARGVAGPVVVDFSSALPNPASAGCKIEAPALAAEIAANPAGFYVNVHTATFPGGAVRGQLGSSNTRSGDTLILDVPRRAYDSREFFLPDTGGPHRLTPAGPVLVNLATDMRGTMLLPPGASAALVRITVTDTVGAGWLKAYSAALATPPETASLNWYETGSIIGTDTTVAVDPRGFINVFVGVGQAHVVVDVFGYIF